MYGRALLFLLLAAPRLLVGQADFRVYTDHPRLFLDDERLLRIQRNAERNTPRWVTLEQKVRDGAELAEPPLAQALVYQASGAEENGRLAVEWALAEARRGGLAAPGLLRWGAIVFDWCYGLLSADERGELAAALAKAAEQASQLSGRELGAVRDGVLASIALAGEWDGSERALQAFLETQWSQDILPLLESGQLTDRGEDLIALTEMAHVVRHNLERDLWSDAPRVFPSLPMARILGYLPETIETAEGRARRPAFVSGDELEREAVLARIAEMLLVAYEPVAREFQFLQGWLRNDSFTLTGPLGAPYEFLWINPYLPGLSPSSGPQLAYDDYRGRIFGRLGWENGGPWFAYLDGRILFYQDGRIAPARQEALPIETPGATVTTIEMPGKVQVKVPPPNQPDPPRIYLVGLEENRSYNVRVNRADWALYRASAGGVIRIVNQLDEKTRQVNFNKPVKIEIRKTLQPPPGRSRPTLGP